MVQFRDWPATLRDASYRGAPFFVETYKVDGGRRLVVHEFPLADDPYVEDLGRDSNRIEITAYVVGDDADDQAETLRAACERGGSATLALPIDTFKAHCQKCARDFTKDKLGYIAFSLSFVRSGTGAAPFPLSYLSRIVETAGLGLGIELSSIVGRVFSTIGFASFVADAAADELRAVASICDSAARSSPVLPQLAPGLYRAIGDLYDAAATLTAAGQRGDAYDATAFIARSSGASPTAIVDQLQAITSMMQKCIAPDELIAVAQDIAGYVASDVVALGHGSNAAQASRNASTLQLALRVLGLGLYAAALVNVKYSDRRAAIQARADAAETFADELDRVSTLGEHALYVQLQTLAGNVAEFLSRQIADLAPIVVVSAPLRMPSLYWAQRLYGDAGRAGELVARNAVAHPSFMPVEFEALAPSDGT